MIYVTREEYFALYPDGGQYVKCFSCRKVAYIAPGLPKACCPEHAYSMN